MVVSPSETSTVVAPTVQRAAPATTTVVSSQPVIESVSQDGQTVRSAVHVETKSVPTSGSEQSSVVPVNTTVAPAE